MPGWCEAGGTGGRNGRRAKDLRPTQKGNPVCRAPFLFASRTGIASDVVTGVDIVAHITSGQASAQRLCEGPAMIVSGTSMNLHTVVSRRLAASRVPGIVFVTLHSGAGTFNVHLAVTARATCVSPAPIFWTRVLAEAAV